MKNLKDGTILVNGWAWFSLKGSTSLYISILKSII